MILKFQKSCWAILILSLMPLARAAEEKIKIMTIGDSLTEEYYFEFPFSAPNKEPLMAIPGDANTKNWVEILAEQRNNDLDFGSYETDWPFGYDDWRQAGYAYNFGIPGSDTHKWMRVIEPLSIFDSDYDFAFDSLAPATRSAMRALYTNMDVIVIMVGGNDVNFQYGDLYDATLGDPFSINFKNSVIANLTDLIDEVRDHNPTVPIILANIPDLSASPDIIIDHPDPIKRANASDIVNDLNTAIAVLAASRGLTLAPISNLTDQLLSPDALYIGAHLMIKDADPEEDNRPHYMFCWKGLHPSTNGQAIIANVMIDAINTATGNAIEKLPNREILTDLLGLNPDQPYLDWAGAKGLTDTSMNADADGDGLPNIGEYLLDLNPTTVNTDHLASLLNISGTDYLSLSYTPNTAALRLVDGVIKYSTDLDDWKSLPAGTLVDLGGGSFQARIPINDIVEGHAFMRFEFALRP